MNGNMNIPPFKPPQFDGDIPPTTAQPSPEAAHVEPDKKDPERLK